MSWPKGHKATRGSSNANALLNESDVAEIKRVRSGLAGKRLSNSDPRSLANIARRYGVNRTTICAICNGRSWKHVELP